MMEQRLFILLFFTGFAPLVLSVSIHKYYLIQQGKTWSEAQAYCRTTHTDLAIIKSNEDMVQLQNEAQSQQFSSRAWIGIYNDVNNWRWSLRNEPLESVGFWSSGEPNNYAGIETCGAITPLGWNDMQCKHAFASLCFDGNKTGNSRYIHISSLRSWAEAQEFCRQSYTDLVSIKDGLENTVVLGMVSGATWIGLFRETWKWTDQTNVSTISWMSGQPDNSLLNEDCVFLNNGQAADAQCSEIMPFFCYSVITGKQQILKMKVQSSQDVNDPPVKAAILGQIMQKLKDHGIAENITVRWREESNGKVFHKEKEEL